MCSTCKNCSYKCAADYEHCATQLSTKDSPHQVVRLYYKCSLCQIRPPEYPVDSLLAPSFTVWPRCPYARLHTEPKQFCMWHPTSKMGFHPSQAEADLGVALPSPGCTRSIQTVACPLETCQLCSGDGRVENLCYGLVLMLMIYPITPGIGIGCRTGQEYQYWKYR